MGTKVFNDAIEGIKNLVTDKTKSVLSALNNSSTQVKFGNMYDYLEWRGDISFDISPLNAVDALAFSILAYLRFGVAMKDNTPMTLLDIYNKLKTSDEDPYSAWVLNQKMFIEFIKVIPNTTRFSNIKVCCYEEKIFEGAGQFSAVTFLLPDKIAFVAYRGTDNSLVGWKEDFYLSFTNGTVGQIEAQNYIDKVAALYPDYKLCLGGHSKGGNFAVWAGVKIAKEYKDRILYIYNNDGPGFLEEFTESEEYKEIETKIMSFVPDSSIIGVLLSHCEYITIRSTNTLIMQHDPFSWEIIGKRFIYDTERSNTSKLFEKAVNKQVQALSDQEKSKLVEEIFNMLEQQNVTSAVDIKKNPIKHLLFTAPKLVSKFKETLTNIKGKTSTENE